MLLVFTRIFDSLQEHELLIRAMMENSYRDPEFIFTLVN